MRARLGSKIRIAPADGRTEGCSAKIVALSCKAGCGVDVKARITEADVSDDDVQRRRERSVI